MVRDSASRLLTMRRKHSGHPREGGDPALASESKWQAKNPQIASQHIESTKNYSVVEKADLNH
jgi:hypothetical protein